MPPKSEPEIPKKVVDAPKTEPKKTPKPEKPTEPPRKKPTETPEPPKKAPEPPFKEFAFDSSATLTRNEQIFRSIYSTDRTIARNVSPEEIKRVGDLMAAYNRFSGPLKTARKTKDIKAIASAEAEMLTFLKDPAE